jgi:putative Holliday junction resolvase
MTSSSVARSPARPGFPLLGLDVSASKIGLAISEASSAMPQPLFTYLRITRARDLAQCVAWTERYQAQGVVMGLPLNMDGSVGPRAHWMQRFQRELQARIPIPVLLQDERLSTIEADEMLIAQGYGWEARSERVDAVAAALILERFLQE